MQVTVYDSSVTNTPLFVERSPPPGYPSKRECGGSRRVRLHDAFRVPRSLDGRLIVFPDASDSRTPPTPASPYRPSPCACADPLGIPAAFWYFLARQRSRINPKVDNTGQGISVLAHKTVRKGRAGGGSGVRREGSIGRWVAESAGRILVLCCLGCRGVQASPTVQSPDLAHGQRPDEASHVWGAVRIYSRRSYPREREYTVARESNVLDPRIFRDVFQAC